MPALNYQKRFAPLVEKVRDIQIKANGTVLIDGQAIYQKNAEAIALRDGFVSLQEFIDFFCPAGDDFRGQYIEW